MGEREGTFVREREAVQALYDRGLYLQALRMGEAALPLREWPGTHGKILAGRLAHRLGARRLGERLHQEAWRADPGDAFALYYRAYGLLAWRGPLAAWEFLGRHAPAPDAPVVARADLLALHARVLAGFRDFTRAEGALAQAEALTPERAWLGVERAGVLEAEDRYPEALERIERVLAQRPWYGPAVLSRAHLLLLVDRDEEAAEFLREALEHTENGAAAAQRVRILHELGRHEEAWSTLARVEALMPLADRRVRQAIAAQRSELAYLRGDAETSIAQARLAETAFHRRVVQSLERSPTVTRKLLPVAFVRQHHMTCGPASLTALGRYFDQPTEHLEVAEQICYGGTTNHSERRWAELNGFVAREFTVTHAGVRALVDRGLPFAVSTVEATSGHMQVIVGYDENRDTFLVRDPYQPTRSEWLAQEFLARYRATGPRGLVLVPEARAHELEGLVLEDSALHDLHHRLQSALQVHDWAGAEAAQRELEAAAPDHRLVHQGRLALCSYAQDLPGMRSALERWLALHPRDPRLLHMQVRTLEDLGRREERLLRLTAVANEPGADPIFRFELARLLAEDARQRDEAEHQLRLALRRAPQSAANLWLLSRLVFEAGERARALELLRFAVCLEETNEGLAESYFGVSHALGRSEEALVLLRDRFERFARRSSLPARSLFKALDGLRRTDEAFAVLERALEARPDDGSLFLFAATSFGDHGRSERARELLERAGPTVHAAELLRARADLAVFEGDLPNALAGWRAVAELEPLAVDARQRIFALVKAIEGEEGALLEARAVAERFPFHAGLQRLCIGLLGPGHPGEAEGLLLALLERHPTDDWALRELALRRLDQGKPEAALEALREAHAIDPREASTHGIEALVHRRAVRPAEALAAARAGVACSVDHVPVLDLYLRLAWEQGQGPQALAEGLEHLRAQHTNGDGLVGWWNVARSRPEGSEVLAALEALRAERPELWQAHVALVRQRLALQQADEALEAARAACERLPLHHEVWLVRAQVHKSRGEPEEERHALESALALSPRSAEILRQLALLHERRGEYEPSRRLLERAIALSPLDVENHCWLADTLLLLALPAEAVARVEHALRLAPRESGVWQLHARCARADGRAERTLELLREGTRARPDDPGAWLLLAEALSEPQQAEERLAAARRAHEIDARHPESLDLLARILGDEGRIAEALGILESAAAAGELPIPLRGRRAWLIGRAGRSAEAVELFRELLRLDPDYGWGWRQLTGLLDGLGRHAEYRDAAAVLVRQNPGDPVVHTLLGDGRKKCGDRSGAKAAYRQALALNPAAAFAAERLLELQVADGELSGARETLARSGSHLPAETRAVQTLRLACEEGDVAAVERSFAAILRDRTLESWAPRFAAKVLRDGRYVLQLAAGVQAAMGDGRAEVGELWVDLELEREGWGRMLEKILALPAEAETTLGAITGFLNAAADQKQLRVAKRFLEQRQDGLAGNVRTWGSVGRFWLVAQEARTCERWLADWRRPDAAPWMLLNLGLAQRSLGRRAEARAVSERALELDSDHTTHLHHALLAADEFLAGDLAAARRHLHAACAQERGPYFEFLVQVLGETLRLQASADPRADFPAVRRAVSAAREAFPGFRGDEFLREFQLASALAIARRRGGLLAWLWWARQRL